MLLDPERFYEAEEFTPTRLEDMDGNDRDLDGIPYIEKYKENRIAWVPPTGGPFDHGYFLFQERKGGLPTAGAKLIHKSRICYSEKGLLEKRNPQWDQVQQVFSEVFE